VHLFRPSVSFLAEAQPRLDNRRGQKALFGKVCIKNLSRYLKNIIRFSFDFIYF
jgi:hypothetical protein